MPRGFPEVLSLHAAQFFWLLVTEDEEVPDRYFWPADRHVPRSRVPAAATVHTVQQWFNGNRAWAAMADPALWNPTWLTPAELASCVRQTKSPVGPITHAAAAAIGNLTDHLGPDRVRFVLGFDN